MFQAFYRAIHNTATTSTATATYCATTVATVGQQPAACTVAERHKGTRCPLSQWKAWQQNGWTIWCIFTDSVYLRVSVFSFFFLLSKILYSNVLQIQLKVVADRRGILGTLAPFGPISFIFIHCHCNAVNMFSYACFFLGCFCLGFPSSFTLISLLIGSPLCHAQVTYVHLPYV